jgi:hypothetical protein
VLGFGWEDDVGAAVDVDADDDVGDVVVIAEVGDGDAVCDCDADEADEEVAVSLFDAEEEAESDVDGNDVGGTVCDAVLFVADPEPDPDPVEAVFPDSPGVDPAPLLDDPPSIPGGIQSTSCRFNDLRRSSGLRVRVWTEVRSSWYLTNRVGGDEKREKEDEVSSQNLTPVHISTTIRHSSLAVIPRTTDGQLTA